LTRPAARVDGRKLYIHHPTRKHRALDEATEKFIDATRVGAA